MLIAHPRKHGQCTQRAPSDLETALADRAMYSRSEVPPFNPYFPYEEGVCITENTGDTPELDDGGKRRKTGLAHHTLTLLRPNLGWVPQPTLGLPKESRAVCNRPSVLCFMCLELTGAAPALHDNRDRKSVV